MSWKLRAAVSALLLAPQAAFSLGLGDIRLSSALNEPLSAEIELVAPTSDELSSLSAQLASRELFQRLGLDRPAYLDTVQLSLGRGKDGRNALLVTSAAPISEPFVTFVVEVTWPRGRLLREYTVLLDPPVFAPQEAVPPVPVAAPRATVPTPAPAPTPAPMPAPAAPPSEAVASRTAAPAAAAGTTYTVQRGDTLYRVASKYSGGGRTETNRMMIAIFRGNPDAFGGNINILRSGAVLRVPGPESLADISAGEAASEIGRQTAAWRGGEAAQEPARLRLVTPSESTPAAAESEPEPVATDPAARIEQLNREIDDSRRLLEMKSAELARLQQEVAERAAAAQPQPEAPAPEAAPAAPEAAAPAGPAPAEAPAPAVPEPEKAAPEEPAPEPSFIDSLTDNWQYVFGAAVLLLGGGLALGYVRRRREEEFDESIQSFEPPPPPATPEGQRLRVLSGGSTAAAGAGAMIGTTTEQQELEDFQTATLPPSGRTARDHGARFDETLSTEEPADLDKGDPLAEADFHMAYGLYDQAADIVRLGLEREPGRRDYEMKLLEIFFVAGEKQQFLETARKFSAGRGDGDKANWDRVLIMGHQLAPEDPMFQGAAPSGDVDLNLEGGDNRVDLELLAPPQGEEGMDLDLGEALEAADSDAETGEAEALDFDLDAAGTGIAPTVEMSQLGEGTAELPAIEETRLQSFSSDATAEMPMDELGIDLGDLDALPGGGAEDDVTLATPADEATRRMPTTGGGMDFDLSDLSPEVSAAGAGTEEVTEIVDVGSALAGESGVTEQISLDELPQMSELEPVTMSEVGTKLDLARAYVDMGDPDGARSILEEVLKEGSASQKQEARRLLESLPGA